jgi:hypothetical protein
MKTAKLSYHSKRRSTFSRLDSQNFCQRQLFEEMLSRFVLVEGNRLCVKSPEVPSSLHGKTNKCTKSINANASHRERE